MFIMGFGKGITVKSEFMEKFPGFLCVSTSSVVVIGGRMGTQLVSRTQSQTEKIEVE